MQKTHSSLCLIYTAKPSANWETDRRCCCRSRRSRGKEEKKDQQKAKLRTFRKRKKKKWKRKEKRKKKCSVKSLELFPLPGCLTEAEARVNKLVHGSQKTANQQCALRAVICVTTKIHCVDHHVIRHTSLQEQRYPFLSVCAVFLSDQTMVWLPVFGIFNVHTDVDACDCAQGKVSKHGA